MYIHFGNQYGGYSEMWESVYVKTNTTWIHIGYTKLPQGPLDNIFITALFIIARNWQKPRCLSFKEWIKKMWNIYTMEYYSVVFKKT